MSDCGGGVVNQSVIVVVFIVLVVSCFSSDNVNVATNHEQETGGVVSDGVEEFTIEARFLLPGPSEGGCLGYVTLGASQKQPKRAPKGTLFYENAIRKGDGREFTPRRRAPL